MTDEDNMTEEHPLLKAWVIIIDGFLGENGPYVSLREEILKDPDKLTKYLTRFWYYKKKVLILAAYLSYRCIEETPLEERGRLWGSRGEEVYSENRKRLKPYLQEIEPRILELYSEKSIRKLKEKMFK